MFTVMQKFVYMCAPQTELIQSCDKMFFRQRGTLSVEVGGQMC